MAKVLCVLYDDPVEGYPPVYARDGVPKIEGYHDGQTAPTPEGLGFTPGELVGCVSGELGLREFSSFPHRSHVGGRSNGVPANRRPKALAPLPIRPRDWRCSGDRSPRRAWPAWRRGT